MHYEMMKMKTKSVLSIRSCSVEETHQRSCQCRPPEDLVDKWLDCSFQCGNPADILEGTV